MKLVNTCLLGLVALGFTACGSSSSSNNSNSDSGLEYKTSLKLADEVVNLGSYKVCADLNQNFKCEDNENTSLKQSKDVTASLAGNTYTFVSQNAALQTATLLAVLNNDEITFATKAAGNEKESEIGIKSSLKVALMQGGVNEDKADEQVAKYYTDLKLDSDNKVKYEENMLNTLREVSDYNKLYFFANTLDAEVYSNDFDAKSVKNNLETTDKKVLNDTGLTKFFDGTNMVDTEPETFPGQDASFGFDKTDGGFKFTKLDANGEALASDASDYSCVRDERTGITWEIKADDDKSPRYKYSSFYHEALGKTTISEEIDAAKCNKTDGLAQCSTAAYVEYLNKKNYCGKNDWRLPTAMEQFNILDLSVTDKVSDADGENHYYYGIDNKIFKDMYTTYDQVENTETYDLTYWSSTVILDTEGNIQKQAVNVMNSYSEDVGALGYFNICDEKAKAANPDDYYCSSYVYPVRLVSEKK